MAIDTFRICIVTNRAQEIKKTLPIFSAEINKKIKLLVVLMTHQPITLKMGGDVALYTMPDIGLTKGVNFALQQIKEKFVIFTDDDCLPGKQWATRVQAYFRQHPEIDIVFGQTLPYEPQKHPGQWAPSVFTRQSNTPAKLGDPHWLELGFNNNMIIRRKIIDEIGGLKPWLGPGAIGQAGEDAEFTIRCQIAGYKIGYDKNILLYHNKWLDLPNSRNQNRSYFTGGIIAYGFYYFQGVKEMKGPLKTHLSWVKNNISHYVGEIIKYPTSMRTLRSNGKLLALDVGILIKSLLLAFIYARLVPIPEQENVVKRFYSHA